jgi:hypothetical protein
MRCDDVDWLYVIQARVDWRAGFCEHSNGHSRFQNVIEVTAKQPSEYWLLKSYSALMTCSEIVQD